MEKYTQGNLEAQIDFYCDIIDTIELFDSRTDTMQDFIDKIRAERIRLEESKY
jgi:hypothetical protein